MLLQNPNIILQRWGRALRTVRSNPDKYGTLALPCFDPYAPDEDQVEQWKALGFEDTARPDRDGAEALHSRFDLACLLTECAVDSRNLALGKLISVVHGGAARPTTGGGGSGGSAAPPGGSLLKMTIARPKASPVQHHLRDADVALLQRMAKAINRPLLSPRSPDAWLDVLRRWRLANLQRPLHAPGTKEVYEDAEYGPVNLGAWVDGRKHEARGNRNPSPAVQAAALSLMPRITEVSVACMRCCCQVRACFV